MLAKIHAIDCRTCNTIEILTDPIFDDIVLSCVEFAELAGEQNFSFKTVGISNKDLFKK